MCANTKYKYKYDDGKRINLAAAASVAEYRKHMPSSAVAFGNEKADKNKTGIPNVAEKWGGWEMKRWQARMSSPMEAQNERNRSEYW